MTPQESIIRQATIVSSAAYIALGAYSAYLVAKTAQPSANLYALCGIIIVFGVIIALAGLKKSKVLDLKRFGQLIIALHIPFIATLYIAYATLISPV